MVVPIGMLQPPLFWTKPKSLTFGAFGIVVGKCVRDVAWLPVPLPRIERPLIGDNL